MRPQIKAIRKPKRNSEAINSEEISPEAISPEPLNSEPLNSRRLKPEQSSFTPASRTSSSAPRNPAFDVLRVIAVFAIIMVHTMPVETRTRAEWWFNSLVTPVLLSFVGIYFMTSGMFLLERGTENIGRFYRKRLVVIGIPFLVYDLIYYCYNVYADHITLSIPGHMAEFVRQVVTAGVPRAGHLWYMYAIGAFYICAPFLARMMKAMTDGELKLLLLFMLVLQGMDTAGEITGISISPWTQYVLYTGWIYYFMLGYGLKRLCKREYFLWAAVLGVIGFLSGPASKILLPWWEPQNPHKAPSMVFLCAFIFLLFEYYGDKIPGWIGRLSVFLGRYSYSMYLIHFLIVRFFVVVALDGVIKRHYIAGTAAAAAVGFVLSFLCAVLVDGVVVRPIIRLIIKAVGKE